MSNVSYLSAEQQCRIYVEKQRQKARRAAADRAIADSLGKLAEHHGGIVVLGALIRYVGSLLIEAADRNVMIECRRYLTRKIVRSVVRGFLTRHHLLH